MGEEGGERKRLKPGWPKQAAKRVWADAELMRQGDERQGRSTADALFCPTACLAPRVAVAEIDVITELECWDRRY